MAQRKDTLGLVAGSEPQGEALTNLLASALIEIDLVAGAAADTNIAVPDIESNADDDDFTTEIIFALHFPASGDADSVTDITSEITVPTDGNIQVGTTDTTGGKILLVWADPRRN